MENAPKRIQLSRAKGWRKPENTVVVSRPSKWGNPFSIGRHGMTLEMSLALYRDAMTGFFTPNHMRDLSDADFDVHYRALDVWRERINDFPINAAKYELAGKNMACWCRLGTPCHANKLTPEEPLANTLQDEDR